MDAVTGAAGNVQVRRHKTTDVIHGDLQRRVRLFTDRRALDAEKERRELHRVAGLNLGGQRVVVGDNAQRLGKLRVHQLQGIEHHPGIVGVGVGFFFGGGHFRWPVDSGRWSVKRLLSPGQGWAAVWQKDLLPKRFSAGSLPPPVELHRDLPHQIHHETVLQKYHRQPA